MEEKKLAIIIFLAVPLIILLVNVGAGRVIAGADEGAISMMLGINEGKYFGLWNPNMGGVFNDFFSLAPLRLAFYFLYSLGIPSWLINFLFNYSSYVLSSISMYVLLSYYGFREKEKIVGSFFYTFNVFTLVLVSPFLHIIYSLLPLVLYFWIIGIEGNRSFPSAFKFAFVASITFSLALFNPPLANIVILLPIMYFAYSIAFLGNWRDKALFAILVALMFLLLNAWNLNWLMERMASTDYGPSSWSATGASKLIDLYWLAGLWSFRMEGYYPYANVYNAPLFNALMLLLPILLALSIKKLDRKTLFFGFLLLTSFFLASGRNPPLGMVYTFLYGNFPGFWIYREPYTKFVPLLALSVSFLVALTMRRFAEKISGKQLFAAFLVGILVYAFPFFNGDFLKSYGDHFKANKALGVPEYWLESVEFIKGNLEREKGILVMPEDNQYGAYYFWGNDVYSGTDIVREVIPGIIWAPGFGTERYPPLLKEAYYRPDANFSSNKYKIYSQLGIKYVLVRSDYLWSWAGLPGYYGPEDISKSLIGQKNMKKIRDFGKLSLFENTEANPTIYLAGNLWVIGGDEKPNCLLNLNDYRKDSAVFFGNESKGLENFSANEAVIFHLKQNGSRERTINESMDSSHGSGEYSVIKPVGTRIFADGKEIEGRMELSGDEKISAAYENFGYWNNENIEGHAALNETQVQEDIEIIHDGFLGLKVRLYCVNGTLEYSIYDKSADINKMEALGEEISSGELNNLYSWWSYFRIGENLPPGNYTLLLKNTSGTRACFVALGKDGKSSITAWNKVRNGTGINAVYDYGAEECALLVKSSKKEYSGNLSVAKINNALWKINYSAKEKNIIVFASNYDEKWVARNGMGEFPHIKCMGGLNCYVLPGGDFEFEVAYLPQEKQDYANAFSLSILVILLIVFFMTNRKTKQ